VIDRRRGGQRPDRVRGRVVPDVLWGLHDDLHESLSAEHSFEHSCRSVSIAEPRDGRDHRGQELLGPQILIRRQFAASPPQTGMPVSNLPILL
jgi:hypothetical protein